jgi:hypothetical protein
LLTLEQCEAWLEVQQVQRKAKCFLESFRQPLGSKLYEIQLIIYIIIFLNQGTPSETSSETRKSFQPRGAPAALAAVNPEALLDRLLITAPYRSTRPQKKQPDLKKNLAGESQSDCRPLLASLRWRWFAHLAENQFNVSCVLAGSAAAPEMVVVPIKSAFLSLRSVP